jgi:hypothetical protein
MPTPDTEALTVVGARSREVRFPALVPTLCGIVVAGSWFAGCLAVVLPA